MSNDNIKIIQSLQLLVSKNTKLIRKIGIPSQDAQDATVIIALSWLIREIVQFYSSMKFELYIKSISQNGVEGI